MWGGPKLSCMFFNTLEIKSPYGWLFGLGHWMCLTLQSTPWIEYWYFLVRFSRLGRLHYHFQFLISFLPHFSNGFGLYKTRLGLTHENQKCDIQKSPLYYTFTLFSLRAFFFFFLTFNVLSSFQFYKY